MPTNHVLALGPSAGVVTSPIAYIQKQLANWYDQAASDKSEAECLFDLNDEWHNTDPNYVRNANRIDKIIVLTSKQIIEGTVKGKCRWNEYGAVEGEDREGVASLEQVREFLQKEFGCSQHKPKLYVVEIKINDFEDVVYNTLKVLNWLVPLAHRGDNTWVNVTGLTNVVNEGMLTAAYLMGTVGRIYYTFVDRNTAHIRPVEPTYGSGLHFWNDLPLLRIDLSDGLFMFLEELGKYPQGVTNEELLIALNEKNPQLFKYDATSEPSARECVTQFNKMYLNKLSSYVRRIHEHTNKISLAGAQLLRFLSDPTITRIVEYNRNPQPPTPGQGHKPKEENRPGEIIPLEYCGTRTIVAQVTNYTNNPTSNTSTSS